MSNKKTPEIRFEGFNDDWEQRKLGDFSKRIRGNDGRMNLPTLTMSASVGWMNQIDRFSGNIAGKEQKNYTLLKKGELSYNHGNSKLAKYGVVFVLNDYEEALVPRVYHSFKIVEGNGSFIEQYFGSKLPDRELGKLVSSGARMDGLLNINYEDFTNISLTVPKFEEQTKIGNFFKKLDETITLQERELNLLKEQKKGFLQKMFPKNNEKVPELRFKGFTDNWEQRKLDSIADATYGGGTPKTSISEYWDGNFPWIQSSDLQNDKLNDVEPTKFITEDAINHSATKKIPANSIAIVTRVGVGKLAFMPYQYSTSQDFLSLSQLKIDNSFALFSMYKLLKVELNNIQGTSIKGITKSDLLDKNIYVPLDIEEQSKIGNLFKQIDETITLQEQKLNKLKEMKKGFLQKMFI